MKRCDRAGTARADHGRDHGADRHHRSHDRAAGARLLRQSPHRCGAGAGVRGPHRGLGAASGADVRVLVVGRADVRPLSRHADGQAHAAAGRCRAFRPLAGTVRGRPPARSVRPRPQRISSNWRGGSQPASNSASPAGRASCSATAKDFGATRQEQCNDRYRAHVVTNKEQANPYSGSSLVPMLVIGSC